MDTELKQRKAVVHRKRTWPTTSTRPEELMMNQVGVGEELMPCRRMDSTAYGSSSAAEGTPGVNTAFTCFVDITFLLFGGLLVFFGGFAFTPTTYFLPYIMWLAIYKPRRFSPSWITNWVCIILGVLLMLLSPIGGLRQIIFSAKNYKFYS